MGWTLATLALILAAVALFIALFRWNWLREPIDAVVSARLGRQVVIHGDLSGHVLSWTPSLTADDVTVAEPAWTPGPPLARFPRLTVALDLKALLGGRPALAFVDADHPAFHLIRDARGRNNWTFGAPDAPPQPLRPPAIRRLAIESGHVDFRDAGRRLRFNGVITSRERILGYGHGHFELTGAGSIDGAPFTARIDGGVLLGVDPGKPYPFESDIRAGATHIVATGDIRRPFDLGAFEARGRISGADMADLYRLTGLALPDTPPYALQGELVRQGTHFEVRRLSGRLGSSDIAGRVTVTEPPGGRPYLTADLASRRLSLADLTAVIGGAPTAAIRGAVVSPTQRAEAARLTAEHRLLPSARLDVTRIRRMDADVRYHAETVAAGPTPVRKVAIRARLAHGVLTLDPISLTLPQGALSGDVQLDARGAIPATTLDLTLAHAEAQELLPAMRGEAPAEGPLLAAARLEGRGASVRDAAATANGVVTVAMPGGRLRSLLAEAMGVDVARSLFLYLTRSRATTPIRCAVADFRARDGVLSLRRMVIDTGAVVATGKGEINLRNETMDIVISGRPKHLRLLRIAAPITLTGRLDDPHAGIEIGKAAPQLALSAALGALVAPAAAIVPLVGIGAGRRADCSALLAEAQRLGAPLGAGARGQRRPLNGRL